MALVTLTAAFAYVTQRAQWKRWVLFLSAFPLAVLGNVARVLGVALVGNAYGQVVAMRVHDTMAGFIVFGVALAAMMAFGFLLNVPYRHWVENWLTPVSPVTAARPVGAGQSDLKS
jgi:exosortase/archaeosortase family protein